MFLCAAAVIFIFTAVGRAEPETYKKGGVAVLSPGSVSGPITSITWNHGRDIAVEWYGEPMTVYRDFRGRCELNATTGALTISNLLLKDGGSYTAEINSRIMKTTEIRVITAVPKPTISTHCNPGRTRCTLTCDANVTKDTGSVTYSWEIGDRRIPESPGNWIDITQNDTESVGKLISCQLENPVGSERSDDIMSPFLPSSSSVSVNIPFVIVGIVGIVGIVLFVVIVAALVGFVIFYKRRQQNAGWRQYFDMKSCLNPERNSETENSEEAGSSYQPVSTEDPPGPESTGTNNGAAKSPENQAVTNQHQPEPVSTDTNNEAEMPTSSLKIENEAGPNTC